MSAYMRLPGLWKGKGRLTGIMRRLINAQPCLMLTLSNEVQNAKWGKFIGAKEACSCVIDLRTWQLVKKNVLQGES